MNYAEHDERRDELRTRAAEVVCPETRADAHERHAAPPAILLLKSALCLLSTRLILPADGDDAALLLCLSVLALV